MLWQTERLEQLELLERELGDFDLKALKNFVISAFDKEIQNKTHQKEKNRSRLASVMAGAGGFEPATHGFGVALRSENTLVFSYFERFYRYFRQFKTADFLFDALLMLQIFKYLFLL